MKEGREAELWADITPTMMSEEEKEGEVYVRHPPTYRSQAFKKFIEKLDQRLNASTDKSKHPRMDRRLGSPRERPIPPGCKKWIIKKDLEDDSLETREDFDREVDDTWHASASDHDTDHSTVY